MLSKKHIINVVSSGIVITTGGLFIMKYSSRFTGLYPLLVIIYFSASSYLIWCINTVTAPFMQLQKKIPAFRVWQILFVVFCLLYFIIPAESRVGRHNAINEWLSTLLRGGYPYGISSNPSGMPMLFFIALPFYLASDAGFLVAAGSALIITLIYKTAKYKREFYLTLALLLITPVLYYEYLVRSELLTNMVLAIAVIIVTKYLINSAKPWGNLVISILWGVLLSTRLTVLPIFVLGVLFFYRQNIRELVIVILSSLLVFTATLLPFYLTNPPVFIEHGPFAIQLLYLPFWVYPFFGILTLYIGWLISDIQELYFTCGVLLFILVVISFFQSVLLNGFYSSVFNDRFDISYFILPVPFFLFSIKEYSVDRYLGKVLIENIN